MKIPFSKLTLLLIIGAAFILQNCKSSQASQTVAKVSYDADLKPLMVRSCTPCHFPEQGKKEMLDTYDATRVNIKDIIARMEMDPSEKGYMPFKSKKEAMSTEEVQKFKDWMAQGFAD